MGEINLSTNTQVNALDHLERDIAVNATPEDARNRALGTLDDGVDIDGPYNEAKAETIETKLEQSDGTTDLRADPQSTAVTMPPEEIEHTEDSAGLEANKRTTKDYKLADEAFAIEEPSAPQL